MFDLHGDNSHVRFCPPNSLASRLLSSPLLFVVLLVAALTFVASWYQTESVRRAPDIAGYDWGKHPNTLLIAAPLGDNCSLCGLSISDLSAEGLKHGLDVLVIAARDSRELKTLRKSHPHSRLSIVTNINQDIIK